MHSSVILTVYEQKGYLPYLIECLKRQDVQESWELIVCDDGSASDMLEPLKGFSRHVNLDLRYLWQTDRGFRAGKARNGGIRCANGKVLIFLDGDSLIPRDFIRRHLHAHDGSPRIFCGSRNYLFTQRYGEKVIREWLEDDQRCNLFASTHLPTASFQRSRIAGSAPWSALIGCNFSVLHHPAVHFDERFVGWGLEDYELGLRLVTRAGFTLHPLLDNQVCHIEESNPAQFHPFRPKTHSEIINYLRNLNHICQNYPELPHDDLWQTLHGIEY